MGGYAGAAAAYSMEEVSEHGEGGGGEGGGRRIGKGCWGGEEELILAVSVISASHILLQLQAALPPSSIMVHMQPLIIQLDMSNVQLQIHLVIVQCLNTRRPLANPSSRSETSHFSCVGKQKVDFA
jgi:hypothetical protein